MSGYLQSMLLCAGGIAVAAAVLILGIKTRIKQKSRLAGWYTVAAAVFLIAALRSFWQAASPYACSQLPPLLLGLVGFLLLLHLWFLLDLIRISRGGRFRNGKQEP